MTMPHPDAGLARKLVEPPVHFDEGLAEQQDRLLEMLLGLHGRSLDDHTAMWPAGRHVAKRSLDRISYNSIRSTPPTLHNKAKLPFGSLAFLEAAGVALRSPPSWRLAPGRGERSRRHPWRLGRVSSSSNRTRRGALTLRLPQKKTENLPQGGFLVWRWGESNPRPRARTASFYRFIRPFGLSGRGQRTGAPSLPYPAVMSPGVRGQAPR